MMVSNIHLNNSVPDAIMVKIVKFLSSKDIQRHQTHQVIGKKSNHKTQEFHQSSYFSKHEIIVQIVTESKRKLIRIVKLMMLSNIHLNISVPDAIMVNIVKILSSKDRNAILE